MRAIMLLLMLLACLLRASAAVSSQGLLFCDICSKDIGNQFVTYSDGISGTKRMVCTKCATELPDCYLCGLPTLLKSPGAIQFEDGRTLCSRDAQCVVRSEQEGGEMWKDVTRFVEREFSRFLSLPDTNVTFSVVDRIALQSMFKVVGKDFACPNVWGITEISTNNGARAYGVSVLVGLPRSDFRSVCVHELGHVWMTETLSEARAKALDPSAREGFCELLAYLYSSAANDEAAKRTILTNNYTRGQIHLFIQAEHQFGLNEVLDWVRFGTDSPS